jgi:hypothetical protein
LSGVADGKLPTVVDSEPWDGKDGELDVVDDIDLSDVNFDDDEDDVVMKKKKVDL